MKKTIFSFLIIFIFLVLCNSVDVYASDNGSEYTILSGAKELDRNDRKLNMSFPTDGKVYFKNVNSSLCEYAYFYFDRDQYSSKMDGISDVNTFSGTVEKGKHYIYLYNIDSNQYTNVSYTFYPNCKVIGLDDNKKYLIGSYLLTNNRSKYLVPTNYKGIKGYIVNHWYLDSALTEEISELDKTSGKDWYLYPKKEVITYNVSYELNNGINSEDNINSYTVEDWDFELKEPYRKGYIFEGWYTRKDFVGKVTQIKTDNCKNMTLYAKWTPRKYSIMYENVEKNVNPQYYTINNKDIILKDPERKGYDFAGWYSDKNYEHRVTVIKASECSDVTLYAKWNAVKYILEYELNGGVQNGDNKTFYTIENEEFELSEPHREGYTFLGWYKEPYYVNMVTKIIPQNCSNEKLYAKWTPSVYLVDYQLNGGMFTCDYNNSYTIEDDNFTLACPEKKGYFFLGWYTSNDYIDKITEINTSDLENKMLYAKWQVKKYNIIYFLDGGTQNQDNKIEYTVEDQNIILQNPEKDNYDFMGWYMDSEYIYPVRIIYTGNCSDIVLYARWKEKSNLTDDVSNSECNYNQEDSESDYNQEERGDDYYDYDQPDSKSNNDENSYVKKSPLKRQSIIVPNRYAKIVKVKFATLKKHSVYYNLNCKSSGKSKITYKIIKGNKKYIRLGKNGKVVFKKGCKKGGFKIQVMASENSKYKRATRVITFKVV